MNDSNASWVERRLLIGALTSQEGSREMADRLAEAVRDLRVEARRVIYRRGETGSHVYIVVDGSVRLHAPGESPWILRAGDGFGFLDLLHERPHRRTAVTVTPTHLLAIDGEDWLELLEDSESLVRALLTDHGRAMLRYAERWGEFGPFTVRCDHAPAEFGADLGLVERLIALEKCRALRSSGVQPLTSLASLAREAQLAAGSAWRPLHAAPEVAFVVQGRIELVGSDGNALACFGPGELVGTLAVLGGETAPGELRVSLDSRVLSVAVEDLFDVVDDHFDLARSLLVLMASERDWLMGLDADGRQ